MTFWDYLSSPDGQEVQHAVIAVLVALAAFLSYRAHSATKSAEREISERLSRHELDGHAASDQVDDA